MSTDRTHRLWRVAGLQVPRRRPRRRVAVSRPRPLPSSAANHVWAYDFVFDGCANGQALKCLTVVDEFTRECLAIDVAGGIRSGRVICVRKGPPGRLGGRWVTAAPMPINASYRPGGRLIKHARYYWLLLAESHLTRRLFGAMLRRIWALPVPTLMGDG